MHPHAAVLATLAKWISPTRGRWLDYPAAARPRVFFANHSSHLDFVVLWASLPSWIRRRTRPVAAQDYWESSPLRCYLATHLFRSVLIPRAGDATFVGRTILSRLVAEL